MKNRNAPEVLIGPITILPFGWEEAKVYGHAKAKLQKSGALISLLDTLIAAHALGQNLALVTNNEGEFKRVNGLKIENWVSTFD